MAETSYYNLASPAETKCVVLCISDVVLHQSAHQSFRFISLEMFIVPTVFISLNIIALQIDKNS